MKRACDVCKEDIPDRTVCFKHGGQLFCEKCNHKRNQMIDALVHDKMDSYDTDEIKRMFNDILYCGWFGYWNEDLATIEAEYKELQNK